MKVLLDEDVPLPLLELLRHILREHGVDHVYSVAWGSKKDVDLYKDARARRYDVVVTNNRKQLGEPKECDAIKRSGRHVIFYDLPNGLQGLALASGAICAAVRPVLEDLATRDRQHLVWVTGLLAPKKRYRISDPSQDPPSPYWR